MFFTKWLAVRQHRKLTKLSLKLKKDFQITQEIREKNYKESLEKQALDLRKEAEEQRFRDQNEWNKKKKELENRISELENNIAQLSELYKNKIRSIKEKFQKEDEKRLLELSVIKDKLELEEQRVKQHKKYWEDNTDILKKIIFEVSARLESRAFINRDIIIKTKRLEDEQRMLEKSLSTLTNHEKKIQEDNKHLEIQAIELPEYEFDINPNEK